MPPRTASWPTINSVSDAPGYVGSYVDYDNCPIGHRWVKVTDSEGHYSKSYFYATAGDDGKSQSDVLAMKGRTGYRGHGDYFVDRVALERLWTPGGDGHHPRYPFLREVPQAVDGG